MAERTAKLIVWLVLVGALAALSGCHIPFPGGPLILFTVPQAMKIEPAAHLALGVLHDYVPEYVLYITEDCELFDENGSLVSDLEVYRGGKVTIWNESGARIWVYFGTAFAPPGDVPLNHDQGVWRRVRRDAPSGGFYLRLECGPDAGSGIHFTANPDTIITKPPNP